MAANGALPERLEPFLDSVGWTNASISPLAGDASFRRYFRISAGEGRNAMLMHAPPPHEDPRPFLDVTNFLRAHDFRAPEIFGTDMHEGFLLLEDFGDQRMREHVDAHPEDEEEVYQTAVDTLIRLEQAPTADVDLYDEAIYLRETALFAEWYLPAMGLTVDQADYDWMWAEALQPIYQAPKVTVLRDYHAENIMLLAGGEQGLIDYQDALVGHPVYDLVSILQDARRVVSPALEAKMLAHYQKAVRPDYDLSLHYALLGAQRNTKIIGIFTRLCQRDGKARYLDFLPRMWGLLERDLEHPGLATLKNWFDLTVPPPVRAASPMERAA